MQRAYFSIAIGLALVLGVGGFVYYQNSDRAPAAEERTLDVQTPGQAQVTEENPDTAPAPVAGITALEVAQHADSSSCWSIINGGVYDLTAWIPQHPGGPERIIQLCGKDGSDKFNGQHGGMSRMATVLMGFKIGVLAQ